MDIKSVKSMLGKTVYFDTGQMNFDGCSIKDFIFNACILRKDKLGRLYYQAELREPLSCPLRKLLRETKFSGTQNVNILFLN